MYLCSVACTQADIRKHIKFEKKGLTGLGRGGPGA
jgi:hypothetical protein